MYKIALYVDDSGFQDLDCSSVNRGNPGIGGTQYEFLLLGKNLPTDCETTIFHLNENRLPENCCDRIVSGFETAVAISKQEGYDVLICHSNTTNVVSVAQKYDMRMILWAHNFLHYHRLKAINECKQISHIVCVGKEEYRYIRMFSSKAVMIPNMVARVSAMKQRATVGHEVTYIGSLIPEKGFHVIAKYWKKILTKIPDAQLNVIGTGYLYNRKAVRGGGI